MNIVEDDDAHCRTREHFENILRTQLCLRFVDDARARCDRAERALIAAHAEAEAALDYLNRTLATTEQSIRIQVMGRR